MKPIVHEPSRTILLPPHQARMFKWLAHHSHRWVELRGVKWLALPHTLDTARNLAADGIEAPSPILIDYDWPAPPDWDPPREFQFITADMLTKHARCYVFNDIGTMKTATALWAADYMMRHGIISRVLIISPLSTLERVWGDEIWKMFPGKRTYSIIHGTREQRERAMQEQHEFYIVNHDGLKVFSNIKEIGRRRIVTPNQFLKEFLRGIDLIIVDEGAVFRNKGTDLWKVLFQSTKDKLLWWMTGTPTPKEPTDAWAQAKIVTPGTVPRNFSVFRDEVMRKVTQFKWVPRKGWEEKVYAMLQPSVRFKRDLLNLPPVVHETRQAELSSEQTKLAKRLMSEYHVALAEGSLTAANEGVKISKLLQIYGGAVYLNETKRTKMLDAAPRLRVLKELLEASGGKAIVFAPFKHQQKLLLKAIEGMGYSVGLINGDVGAGKRAQIFQEFQQGDLQILLAHPETMCHGLTLTATNMIIWWAPIYDNEIYTQANGRISRPGQTKTQLIFHLEASKLERMVYAALEGKRKMQGCLLDLLENRD